MNGAIEIVIHFESFRNIDMLNSGIYQLEFTACFKYKSVKIKAEPVTLESLRHKGERFLNFNPHIVQPGHLIPGSQSLRSRAFMVRYNDEQIKIDDIGTFLIEIPLDLKDYPLSVTVDLLYLEPNSEQVKAKDLKAFKNIHLSKVSTNTFEISNVFKGVHSYIPVSFEGFWSSEVDAMIHTVLFDYSNINPLVFKRLGFENPEINTNEKKYKMFVGKLEKNLENIRNHLYSLPSIISEQAVPKFPTIEDVEILNCLDRDEDELADLVIEKIKMLSKKILNGFQIFRNSINDYSRTITKHYAHKYSELIMRQYDSFVVQEDISKHQIIKKCKTMRKQLFAFNIQVHKHNQFPSVWNHPIFFQSSKRYLYSKCNRNPEIRSMEDIHVVVLVHGYQGFAYDLHKLKNTLASAYPKTLFVESTFNEHKTDDSLEDMGHRLAKEVITFLSEISSDEVPTLSFIGHSIGGLIVRAALPYIECLSDRMHTFMTLSTPHLGMLNSSTFIDAGIWIIKKFKKSQSLKQLHFKDFGFKEGSFLYRLSQTSGLEWFKHVVLFSSSQDNYVTYESARAEIPPNHELKEFYMKMVSNITSKIDPDKIVKIDVNFKLKPSIDSLIGRSAHLQFIENKHFIKMLVYRYPEFFA